MRRFPRAGHFDCGVATRRTQGHGARCKTKPRPPGLLRARRLSLSARQSVRRYGDHFRFIASHVPHDCDAVRRKVAEKIRLIRWSTNCSSASKVSVRSSNRSLNNQACRTFGPTSPCASPTASRIITGSIRSFTLPSSCSSPSSTPRSSCRCETWLRT